jgi:hypothetical protein
MRANTVISHIFLSLVLYNAMALGTNKMLDEGGGWIWMFMGLGSAFLLGMQLMLVVIECKGETK